MDPLFPWDWPTTRNPSENTWSGQDMLRRPDPDMKRKPIPNAEPFQSELDRLRSLYPGSIDELKKKRMQFLDLMMKNPKAAEHFRNLDSLIELYMRNNTT